jgi:hypothetical protein
MLPTAPPATAPAVCFAAAPRLFGWDEPQPQNQYKTLVISPEELQKIQALRRAATQAGELPWQF